jgi:hypothetical protein
MGSKRVLDHDLVSWVVEEALGKHEFDSTDRKVYHLVSRLHFWPFQHFS